MKSIKIRILIVIITIVCISLFPLKVISITRLSDHKLLQLNKVNQGDSFTFSYVHSVSKTPISEVFEINKADKIALKEVQYIDQGGAGMPEYTWNGETFEKQDDKFVLKNFNRTFEHIDITVQPEYFDKLIFEDSELELSKLVKDIGVVKLQVRKIPLLIYYFKNHIF